MSLNFNNSSIIPTIPFGNRLTLSVLGITFIMIKGMLGCNVDRLQNRCLEERFQDLEPRMDGTISYDK